MNELPEPPEAEPPLPVLIMKNMLLIMGAFVSAIFIVKLQYLSGQ